MINMVKLPTKKSNLFLRVAKGHFATSHSHINYYIDVTTQSNTALPIFRVSVLQPSWNLKSLPVRLLLQREKPG